MRLVKLNLNPKSDDFLARYERSQVYLRDGRVRVMDKNLRLFEVRNGNGYGYFVFLSKKGRKGYCSCPDFLNRKDEGKPCKHILASLIYMNREMQEDRKPTIPKKIQKAMAEEQEAEILRDEVMDV